MAGKSYQFTRKGGGISVDFLAVYVMKVKEGEHGVSSALAAALIELSSQDQFHVFPGQE